MLPHDNRTKSNRNAMLAVIVLIALFVASVGRTLSWLEFSNSMENLNVATVLEMSRGGPKLVPTLEGRPRIEKPPLTAWVTSLGVRRSTLDALDNPDSKRRAEAYGDLAMQIRLTALITSALTLLAVFDLGRTIGGPRVGAVSAAICASSFFFLRFGRFATTDVQLTFWIAVTNAFLARAILKRVTWNNALGAGAALGLAFMSKGPVAFIQTILPAIVFLFWRRRFTLRNVSRPLRIAPIVVAAIVMLIVALWWFVFAARQDPSIVRRWLSETNPAGADRLSGGKPWLYLVLLPLMLPWTAFVIDGLIRTPIEALKSWRERRAVDLSLVGQMYPVILLFVSLVVMSCFADRKDRYILPMVVVASVIAAARFVATLDRAKDVLPMWAHWAALIVMSCAPLIGMTPRVVRTMEGTAWFDPKFAITSAVTALVVVAIGAMLYYRGRVRYAPVAAAVLMMFILQAAMIRGYRLSREGRSEMRPLAERIRASYPDAEMFTWRPDGQIKRAPVDLSIYLNRPTTLIADPETLPRSRERPQIYVTLKRKNEIEVKPAPGWLPFDEIKRDKDWYLAFLRPPN